MYISRPLSSPLFTWTDSCSYLCELIFSPHFLWRRNTHPLEFQEKSLKHWLCPVWLRQDRAMVRIFVFLAGFHSPCIADDNVAGCGSLIKTFHSSLTVIFNYNFPSGKITTRWLLFLLGRKVFPFSNSNFDLIEQLWHWIHFNYYFVFVSTFPGGTSL